MILWAVFVASYGCPPLVHCLTGPVPSCSYHVRECGLPGPGLPPCWPVNGRPPGGYTLADVVRWQRAYDPVADYTTLSVELYSCGVPGDGCFWWDADHDGDVDLEDVATVQLWPETPHDDFDFEITPRFKH